MRALAWGLRRLVLVPFCVMPLLFATFSHAQQAYPARPVNILVSFAPGGVMDISTRAIAARAEKFLGQTFVISNNGGGGGAVAAAVVSTQKPDGYNLLACTSTTLIRIPQYRTVPYSLNDFVPIVQHASTESGLAVKADSPFKTLKDLVEYARKNPRKVTYSTLGIGSPMHLSMEYIAKQDGIVWTHVPYPGSMPAVTALLGGHVMATSSSTEWKPFVQEGKLRLLATHGEKRMQSFPNVPTLRELGYDFYNDTTFLVVGPKGTPLEIVKKLEDAFHKAFNDPEYAVILAKIDHVPAFRNSEDTRKFLQSAYELNGKWIAELKIPKETEQKK
ncbi:MAG TPA: tripartite tricarboxylate transporter substrate binding protein [Syntrophorhabdales bacterium]|nr:tripartite tricarboxylate transporter substrate binding protein [Syntrophorhabdales bacterium]